MTRVFHQLNLRVGHSPGQSPLVLIDDGGFNDRIRRAVGNQHRLADLGQEVQAITRCLLQ